MLNALAKAKRIFFVSCFVTTLPTFGHAATPTSPAYDQSWQVISYAAEAGLENQRIFDLTFDNDGTVWLAAADGLRRFDGYHWERFDTNSGLPGTFARSVLMTAKGELWVGTDSGAGVFDFRRKAYDERGSRAGLANSNVRRIVEDIDGALWFACDQWPETSKKSGGLSRLQNGQWKTFNRSDGMPMDYVINYYHSTNYEFAVTPQGWVQRVDGKWGLPVNPGYDLEPYVLQFEEGRNGELFAQGEHHLLKLVDGRWRVFDNNTLVLGRTRDGDIVALTKNEAGTFIQFSIWNGHEFVPTSAKIPFPSDPRFYRLKQAPDGSIWCVGNGTVLRWDYHATRWTFFPDLPSQIRSGAGGAILFSGETNTIICQGEAFRSLPMRQVFTVDRDGIALCQGMDPGELFWVNTTNPASTVSLKTGLRDITKVRPDTKGGIWFFGGNQNGYDSLVHVDRNRRMVAFTNEFRDGFIRDLMAETNGALWVLVRPNDNPNHMLACIESNRLQWVPFVGQGPPLAYPTFSAGAGSWWTYGYPGLYRSTTGPAGPWNQVTNIFDSGFRQAIASPEEGLFLFKGGRTGKSGCLLFTTNNWKVVYGNFIYARRGRGNIVYLVGRGGFYIREKPGTLDLNFISIPVDSVVNSVVPAGNGAFWVGTTDGVLRYQPSTNPPATTLRSSVSEVSQKGILPVAFGGRERFDRGSQLSGYSFSWRFDGGKWTAFVENPPEQLALPELEPGIHQMEARVRNMDGNVDPTPATIHFTVLPTPLQRQPWFRPVVGLLAMLIAGLIWLGNARTRQIAVANAALRQEITVRRQAEAELKQAREKLEIRVAERTAELTRANESLNREIAERKLAEESRQKLEEQLYQSQKMEAIGRLAGGIAHDFNNILCVIIPYCHMVHEELQDRTDLQEHLKEVLKASELAKNLVQQILAFSRQQRQERRVLNLQPVVKESLKLLRSALPSTIQMIPQINATAPVLADPTQIHQLLMNLCVNAGHAMDGKQGRLEVGMEEVLVDDALVGLNADLRPGRYVRLSVRDTGCGMTPETLSRIFEPFFTTKKVNQGTGLGLAVVHGIIRNHDGAIIVRSKPGEGSEFQIFLPVHAGETETVAGKENPSGRADGEHVLVVDDEAAVVTVLKLLLGRAGYNVTAFTDPHEAFNHFRSRPDDFDLIVTDLTMPGMNGLELAGKIFEVRPELPVVIATGFAGELVSEAQIADHPNIRRVLEKPLDPRVIADLAAEIHRRKPI